MNRMFYKCEKLKVLDLSSFNTTDELSMSQMFEECKNLKTIYINKEWNNTITQGKVTGKSFMFDNCLNLVGGKGTKYHKPKLGEDYARIDGGESAPGYFTEKK